MSSPRWCYQFAFRALCFTALISQASALPQEYCSSINTASTPKNSSIYQSNGLCHDFCLSSYAFAIVQGDGCWCSDYAPATTTTGCVNVCPGYPLELCGGNDVYAYIALENVAPSGTEGASSGAASTSSTSTSATAQTSSPPVTTSSGKSSSSSTWTPTPTLSLETLTGVVHTVTVTPTSPPNASSAAGITSNSKKSGLSVGAAVGLTIGLVALVGIICAIIFFCWKKHRQEKEDEYNNSRRGSSAGLGVGSAGGLGPSRTMSQSSRFVLNTDGRQVVETWEPGDNTPGTRSSRLMPVDPRLDPFASVYQRGENKSRESINTIRDDHDYSRRVAGPGPILRATNPDYPEH